MHAEVHAMRKYDWLAPLAGSLIKDCDAVARRHFKCKIKQNWMQGWHYGKGQIYVGQ